MSNTPDMQEVMRAIQDVKRELAERIDGVETKLDKLPDTYVQRREIDSLVDAQRNAAARLDKFDEWRMGMIERMYTGMSQVSTRVEDAQLNDARHALHDVKSAASKASDQRFTLSLAQIGWAIAIGLALLSMFVHPTITLH